MNISLVSRVVVLSLVFGLVGCSSSSKRTKSVATTSSNPFMVSTQKVHQDLTQTETDLGQLESQIKVSK